jgi:hypothetical protein
VVLEHTRQRQRPRVQVGEQLLPSHGRGTRANVGDSGFTESGVQNRQPPGPSRSLHHRLASLATDWFWGMGDIPHLSPPLAAAVAGDPPKSSRREGRGNQGRIELEHRLRLRLTKHDGRSSSRVQSMQTARKLEADRAPPPGGTLSPSAASLASPPVASVRIDREKYCGLISEGPHQHHRSSHPPP